MRRNFHPKVAAFLSSLRTLAQKAGDFMGEPWAKAVSTAKSYSVDAEHGKIRRCSWQFCKQGKRKVSKLSFKYLFASGASTSRFLQFSQWRVVLCHLFLQGHLLPVLLQLSKAPRQECGSGVYKELEFFGAKLATEIIWFAQCQGGCLERAKQSSWGVWGKKAQKSRQLLVSQLSVASARSELSSRRKAQNAPLHLCTMVNIALPAVPQAAGDSFGHTRRGTHETPYANVWAHRQVIFWITLSWSQILYLQERAEMRL